MNKVIKNAEVKERTLKLIRERGVMQAFLAEIIGISRPALSSFLRGIGKLKETDIEKLDALIDTYYTKLPVEV
ncbi:helix-turn-helix domain-containing protein [Paenibacillus sp. FSL P4-0176]|uniref:helix-turn-helix domain-containing protein n=1 Tax=Paenibacillus sp. FSL P4-0176 TaxID=2921631 RepID=UPI0030D5AF4B